MLKGWNINVEGHYKNMKKDLMTRIENLDNISEMVGLSEGDRMEKLGLELNLKKLVDEEGIKLKQSSRQIHFGWRREFKIFSFIGQG
jgi:hypothetical protein